MFPAASEETATSTVPPEIVVHQLLCAVSITKEKGELEGRTLLNRPTETVLSMGEGTIGHIHCLSCPFQFKAIITANHVM